LAYGPIKGKDWAKGNGSLPDWLNQCNLTHTQKRERMHSRGWGGALIGIQRKENVKVKGVPFSTLQDWAKQGYGFGKRRSFALLASLYERKE
jgi:hypothetical protein